MGCSAFSSSFPANLHFLNQLNPKACTAVGLFNVARVGAERAACSFLIGLVVLVFGFSCQMNGQSAPDIENGFKAYGSYDGSDIDTVNLMNGNLMLHIPMPFSYPQRGQGIDPKNVLNISSKMWNVQCVNPLGTGNICSWVYGGGPGQPVPAASFGLGFHNSLELTINRTFQSDAPSGGQTTYSDNSYYITTVDGATHQLVPSPNSPLSPDGGPTSYDAVDLSGLHLDLTNPATQNSASAVVIDRAGNHFQTGTFGGSCRSTGGSGDKSDLITTCNQHASATTVTDANGNVYQLGTLDTMGRSFTSLAGGSSASTGSCVSGGLPLSGATAYSYPGPNGTTQQVVVCYATLTIQTAFGLSGALEAQNAYGVTPPLTANVIVTVIMPDNSSWNFQYDSYGDVTYVKLPLGGSITYGWTTVSGCPVNHTPLSRAVTWRVINDDNGHTFTWNYSWGTPANGSLTNTGTDALRNDTVHTFTSLTGTSTCDFYETTTQYYQGTGGSRQPLKEVDTSYSSTTFSNTSTGTGGLGNVFATTLKTTMFPSGKVSQIQRTPDPGLGLNLPIFGLVTKELQYDWGQGSPGSLLRETDTVYQWQKDSIGNYRKAGLLTLPASIVTVSPVAASNTKSGCPVDAAGTTKACMAETDSTYDESNYLTNYESTVGPLPSGTHGGAPGPVSGNLTTVSKWLSTGGLVTTHTNWYNTGEAHLQIDALGRTTTHSFDSAYAGAFSTKTCRPSTNGGATAHCVSGTYDFNTGALTSFTNENATSQASGTTQGDANHTTVYGYDLIGRLTSATFPPDPNNNSAQALTQFSYPVPITLPFTLTRTKSVTPGLNDSLTTTLDGLGRTAMTQHVTPAGTATVVTQYDGLDHVVSVTNPYFSTSDSTYGQIQTQYDALGRATQITDQDGSMKVLSYSQGGCGGGDDATTTDEAGKTRRTCNDALGHLIEVDEPQSSSLGTSATASVTINGALNTASNGDAARSGSALASYIASNGQIHVDYFDASNHVIEVSPNANGVVQSWDLTSLTNSPPASTSSNLTSWLQSDGPHVVYSNSSGHLQQILNTTGTQDITAMLGLPAAASGTALTSWTTSDGPFFVYVTTSQHLEQVWFSVSAFTWYSKDLTTSSNAAVTAGGTALTNWIQSDGSSHVVYLNSSGHLQQIINTTGTQDLTAMLGLPAAASGTALTSWVQSDGPHFVYITSSQALQQVWYNVAGNAWYNQDLDGASGGPTPLAGSSLATYGNYAVVYQGGNGHVYQDWWSGSAWINNDLTGGNNVTPASHSALSSYVDSSGQHSIYIATTSHVYQLFWNGSSQANLDMTASTSIDSGTLTLAIDGFNATACFGPSTNAACTGKPVNNDTTEVASALAQAVNVVGSPATATASGNTINMVWSTPGPYTPAVSALATSDDNSSLFTTPSFTSSPATFSGGAGPSFSNGYTTLYSYDALGNLLQVNQKGDGSQAARVRSFAYDSLSRLLAATNPESGQISYVYDTNGNVTRKTDARGIIVNYSNDELNRVTQKTYSDGTPTVTYGYDVGCCGVNPQNGVGLLTYTMAGNTELVYVYDIMGRITTQADCPPSGISRGHCYVLTAAYDLTGDVTSLGYPDGSTITYTPWQNGAIAVAGEAQSVIDGSFGINYVTSVSYGADMGLTGFVSGKSGSFAGITNTFSYNQRLQPVNMSASAPSQTVFSIGYDFHSRNGDNGNVFGITNYRDNTRNQSFTYDSLNRLTSAQTIAGDCSAMTVNGKNKNWGTSYGYDAWGNLLTKTPTKCAGENLSVSMTAAANNQLLGYGYDAAGNMTSDLTDGVTATYDAESRILTASKSGVSTTYTYNSLGNRVRKDLSGGPSTEYFYFNSQIVAELDPSTGAFTNYMYFDGDRVARRDGSAGPVSYYFSDHLKTASVVTDASGNVKEDEDYYPWGGELQFVNSDSNHYKFTGKERDAETQLDYFGARYYSNALGRWISADWSATPIPVPYADLTDPQSLNLYSYVRNVPTSRADLDGHDWPSLNDVVNFAAGAANAFGSDNLAGAGRMEQTSTAGKLGQAFGDAAATVTGTLEVLGGVGGEAGGVALDATGVGAVAGVPINVASAGVIAHGGTTAVTSFAHLLKDSSQSNGSNMAPKAGETGGPGAGKDFTDKTKGQAVEENKAANNGQAKCVFCGEDVGPGTNNKINIDHAKAKKNNGTNGLNNANVACEYCNKSKGTGDAPKNPKNNAHKETK